MSQKNALFESYFRGGYLPKLNWFVCQKSYRVRGITFLNIRCVNDYLIESLCSVVNNAWLIKILKLNKRFKKIKQPLCFTLCKQFPYFSTLTSVYFVVLLCCPPYQLPSSSKPHDTASKTTKGLFHTTIPLSRQQTEKEKPVQRYNGKWTDLTPMKAQVTLPFFTRTVQADKAVLFLISVQRQLFMQYNKKICCSFSSLNL